MYCCTWILKENWNNYESRILIYWANVMCIIMTSCNSCKENSFCSLSLEMSPHFMFCHGNISQFVYRPCVHSTKHVWPSVCWNSLKLGCGCLQLHRKYSFMAHRQWKQIIEWCNTHSMLYTRKKACCKI